VNSSFHNFRNRLFTLLQSERNLGTSSELLKLSLLLKASSRGNITVQEVFRGHDS
jgi:hypothetical protein